MSKNLYEIKNRAGVILCFQVATTESDAITFARMYGVRGAHRARFVRLDD